MKKHKVSELTGPMLDYAVAKALGLHCVLEVYPMTVPKPTGCWLIPDGKRLPDYKAGPFEPSTNWGQGGPIIDHEHIETRFYQATKREETNGRRRIPHDHWRARRNVDGHKPIVHDGPTPLIAAMRAFVSAKLGDEVEMP